MAERRIISVNAQVLDKLNKIRDNTVDGVTLSYSQAIMALFTEIENIKAESLKYMDLYRTYKDLSMRHGLKPEFKRDE